MEQVAGNETGKGPTAPYISFQTLKTVAKDMKEHGIPSRIDRTVFSNLSGGTVGQLLPALKFLKLIDDAGQPTAHLESLVTSIGSDAWQPSLSKVIQQAYAPLFSMNLESASPGQFNEQFRKLYPGTDDVSRKSKTFFLNAAQDAGLKISAYITKGTKPRSGPPKARKAKSQNGAKARVQQDRVDPPNDQHTHNETIKRSTSQVVFDAFNPTEMPPDVQEATLKLLTYLKSKGL
jgi:hypothetical protein